MNWNIIYFDIVTINNKYRKHINLLFFYGMVYANAIVNVKELINSQNV